METRSSGSRVLYSVLPSPIGELVLASSADGLTGVVMEQDRHPQWLPSEWIPDDGTDGVLRAAREQLAAYFAGERTAFDLPLAARGTPFQERVWSALRLVPFGTTVSYGEIARRIGSPRAVRAVGAANGRNPLPIVVPCHRVVGADGSLTGFGGGIARKQWLLAHEARAYGAQLDLR